MTKNLRLMFTAFDGDTKRIATLVAHYGSYAAFAKALKAHEFKVAAEMQAVLAEGGKADTATSPNARAGMRLEKEVDRDRAAVAEAVASDVVEEEKASHSKVKPLLVDWSKLEQAADAVEASGAADGKMLGTLITKINAFLERGKADLVAVKDETLSSIRYKKSLKAIGDVLKRAVARRDHLGTLFEATSGPMSFEEQNMVASHKDLAGIAARKKATAGLQTDTQAWALEAADKKGEGDRSYTVPAALTRWEELSKMWGVPYTADDLQKTMKHIFSMKVASNYDMSKPPGANLDKTGKPAADTALLADLLMKSKNFKNVWETKKSQASADMTQRGDVERKMGYGSGITDDNEPRGKADEMPKYAALVSDSQKHGVSARYGMSYVVWKDSVRERMTHTARDSWNMEGGGVRTGKSTYTGSKDPEMVLAKMDPGLLRMYAAEATGKDKAYLEKRRKKIAASDGGGASMDPYIETQIHGELTWDDVAKVVIDTKEAGEGQRIYNDLKVFAKGRFQVELKS